MLVYDWPEACACEMGQASLGVGEERRVVDDLLHMVQPEALPWGHRQRFSFDTADTSVDDSTFIVQGPHESARGRVLWVVPEVDGGLDTVELDDCGVLHGLSRERRRHRAEQHEFGPVLVVALKHRLACFDIGSEPDGIFDVENVINPLAFHTDSPPGRYLYQKYRWYWCRMRRDTVIVGNTFVA